METLERQGSIGTVDRTAVAGSAPAKIVSVDPTRAVRARGQVRQTLLTSFPLAAADLLSLTLPLMVASQVAGLLDTRPLSPFPFLAPTMLLTFALFGLFPGTALNPVIELRQASVATTLLFAASYFRSDMSLGQAAIRSIACLGVIGLVPLLRSVARAACSRFRWWGQPVLILGVGGSGVEQYDLFRSRPGLGLRPVGILCDTPPPSEVRKRVPYLGRLDRARGVAEKKSVLWAVVAGAPSSPGVVRRAVATFPHVLLIQSIAEAPSLWARARDCGGVMGIQLSTSLLLPLPRRIKRAMDLALIVLLAPFYLPLIGFLALLVRIDSPGPVFYAQERIGSGGRRFRCWKFRSMVADADKVLSRHLSENPRLKEEWAKAHKLRNDPRITRAGRILRRTSLDEIPQLWNVFVGDMSLVGPRPIVQAEIPKYGESFELYGRVVPGVTGLWQVSGRNHTTYERRVDLDGYYVRNWSPWLDLYILARTLPVVLTGRGAY